MMNAPPPGVKPLKFVLESGDPTIVRYTYQGVKYTLRITPGIQAIWPTGGQDALGNPEFHMQISQNVNIAKEPASS